MTRPFNINQVILIVLVALFAHDFVFASHVDKFTVSTDGTVTSSLVNFPEFRPNEVGNLDTDPVTSVDNVAYYCWDDRPMLGENAAYLTVPLAVGRESTHYVKVWSPAKQNFLILISYGPDSPLDIETKYGCSVETVRRMLMPAD